MSPHYERASLLVNRQRFVMFITALVLLLKFRLPTAWMIKPAVFYLPMVSVLVSMFADSLAEYLEKRRPDALPDNHPFR